MSNVLIATCSALPNGDEDQEQLTSALNALGIEAQCEPWDAPDVRWDDAALVVIRATWDYTERREEFLEWARDRPRLENPAAVVEWNTDKRYLDQLAARGLPTISTTYAHVSGDLVVPDSERFVIKPTVGAGSKGARLFAKSDVEQARRHIDELAGLGKVAMIQPYLDLVESHGEIAVVAFDGEVSHAIEKGAMLTGGADDPSGLFVAERIRPRKPSQDEQDLAREALESARGVLGLDGPLLYGRVDLLPTPEGPRIIELELTEPSLFLGSDAAAADRFALAIQRRVG